MKKGLLLAMLALQCAGTLVQAKITCGSYDAGFVLSGTSELTVGTMELTEGMIRDTTTSGDAVSGTITCSRANIEIEKGSTKTKMRVDGEYTGGGAIVLDGNNDVLRIESGLAPSTITIGDSSTTTTITARVEGIGDVGGAITIGQQYDDDIDTTLELNLHTPLSQNIVFDAGTNFHGEANKATLKLLSDLQLADGVTLVTTATGSPLAQAVVNCNGNIFRFGGTYLAYGNTAAEVEWQDASIELNAKLRLGGGSTEKGWNFTSAGVIDGNNNELAINASTTTVLTAASDLMLTDIDVTGLQSGNLSTTGTLYLRNASLKDSGSAGHFRVVGQAAISSTNGDLFGSTDSNGVVTWGSAATIELLDDIVFGSDGSWTLGGDMVVLGNGKTVDMNAGVIAQSSSDLYLSDVVLTGLTAGSITHSTKDLYCSKVTIADASGNAIRINGDFDGTAQAPAQMSLTSGKTLVSDDVTFNSGANIELLSNVTFAAGTVWSLSSTNNMVINGHGNVLDLTAAGAGFSVPSSTSLKLRNLVLIIDADSKADGIAGQLDLADVTVILTGSADWSSSSGIIVVNGPTTIVTGGNIFTPPTSSMVNEVTLWFDTMNTPNKDNIKESIWNTNTGRIAAVVKGDTDKGDVWVTSTENEISSMFFLNPQHDSIGGRSLNFNNNAGSNWTFNGHGRHVICGNTSDSDLDAAEKQLFKVHDGSGGNTGTDVVTLSEVILDGLMSEHFEDITKFNFGNGAIIKLRKDDALAGDYAFVDGGGVAQIILDLGGNTLDLNGNNIDVLFSNGSSNLTIKNGRLKGVTGGLLGKGNAANVGDITLQDLDIELSGNATLEEGNWIIAGHTRVMVSGGAIARTLSVADHDTDLIDLTVAAGGTLTLCNGVTLAVLNNTPYVEATATTHSFVLAANSSTLELIGGHLSFTAAPKTIRKGRMIVDHICEVDATGFALTLGDASNADEALDIQLKPGAQIKVTGGTVLYGNSN